MDDKKPRKCKDCGRLLLDGDIDFCRFSCKVRHIGTMLRYGIDWRTNQPFTPASYKEVTTSFAKMLGVDVDDLLKQMK